MCTVSFINNDVKSASIYSNFFYELFLMHFTVSENWIVIGWEISYQKCLSSAKPL